MPFPRGTWIQGIPGVWTYGPFVQIQCFLWCVKTWGEKRRDGRVCIRSRDPTGRVPVQVYCGWRVVPGRKFGCCQRKGAMNGAERLKGYQTSHHIGSDLVLRLAFDQHIFPGTFRGRFPSQYFGHHERTGRCGQQIRLKRVRMADPDLPLVDDNGADLDGLSLMGLVNGWAVWRMGE